MKSSTRQHPLKRYQAKRNFSITPEPAAGGVAAKDNLTFVIQKHWASHLHYDFRLELNGTMKSWAVPKGPSYDPTLKRMAMHVEDHPISYSSFEGVIPPRQYGAGKVIIWDKGTWHPLSDPEEGYQKGNLKFELRGHKLQGRWVLIRMKSKGEKQEPWLLIKEKDEFARSSAEFSVIDEKPDSVKNLSMPGDKKSAGKHAKTLSSAKSVIPGRQPESRSAVGDWPAQAVKAALPAALIPQLATLAAGPPADPQNWLYEIKFDGYRLLIRVEGKDIRLFTRNGHDWSNKLRPLHKTLGTIDLPSGWYDGEIVVPNKEGRLDFGALQLAFDSASTKHIVLYLFDLPFCNGYDLRAVPLETRRAILQKILQNATLPETVRFSEIFNALPGELLISACKLGLEGVIGKRRDSPYVSRRSTDWIKLKCSNRQEFVIGGYTDPQGTRTGIGALLVGVYGRQGDDSLHYAGKVGTGFNQQTLKMLKSRLAALARKDRPFSSSKDIESGAHWVNPTLIAEITFGEWTRAGHIRHSVFQGLRDDKDAKLIVREKAIKPKALPSPSVSDKQARQSGNRTGVKPQSHALSTRFRVTHAERIIDASSGATKIDLVRYYGLVSELMMKHLKGRPVSLMRAPQGVDGQHFFQKHAETEKLPGIKQLDPVLAAGHLPMLEIMNQQGILYAAQWNAIEFHTVNAFSTSYDYPDRMVFDLDPGEKVTWKQVQEAADLVHAFLNQLGLIAFLKTSGGKGLHIVVPLRGKRGWDTVKDFAHAIVSHLADTIPQRFSKKSGATNRVGKIFIDYLRNGQGATTVCAWSARARPGLGISVPVDWDELGSLRGGDHWNVRTAHTRLDKGNDPWKGYSKSARSLTSAMKMLNYTSEEKK